MKKVLVIANLLHASPRIPGIATYLPDFEWQPTIITGALGEDAAFRLGFPSNFLARATLYEIPYRDILWWWRKLFVALGLKKEKSIAEQLKKAVGGEHSFISTLLYLYQAVAGYPDTEKAWRTPVLRRVENLLATERFDAMLSSSPYPVCHLIAHDIKSRWNIPWLADFRDPWSENHFYSYGPVRRALDRRLERATLASADAIVAASPSYAEKESRLLGKSVSVITNEFDPSMVNRPAAKLTKSFSITYTGSIYRGAQHPERILVPLRELIQEGALDPNNVELRFYGTEYQWLEELIQSHNLSHVAQQYGHLSRSDAVARQRESQILLIFGWERDGEEGVYPLKTFEYLAAKRPIMLTGGSPQEGIADILRATKAGVHAVNLQEIKKNILSFYTTYMQTKTIPFEGDEEIIHSYSYPELARSCAKILHSITPLPTQ